MTLLTQTKPIAKITYDEFLEWDGEDQHLEWVEGEIIRMSPVSNRHQDVAGFLLAALRIYVESRHLGDIRSEPYQMKAALHLPGRAPDIFFIANENRSHMKPTYLEGPADLVVEIISPDSRARDRGDKFFEYEAGGIPEYWLLDPVREQAEFYQLGANGIYRLVPADAEGKYHSAVLHGLWLQVEWLWETPLPSLLNVLKQWQVI